MMKKIATIFVGLLVVFTTGQAQQTSDQLKSLADALRARISTEMPNWTHRSIEPIEGSRDLVIQQWESGEISVKIAVVQYSTEERAAEAFATFKSQLKVEEQARSANRGRSFHRVKEDLPSLGAGGVVWNIRGAEAVSFTQGRFRVDVSIATPEQSNDIHFCRVFAAHVAALLQHQ